MYMPSIFRDNTFDSFFDGFPFYDDRDFKHLERKLYGRKAARMMRTDIKEKGDSYELIVDLPGFKKEEVKVSLENGYLTVSAEKETEKDQKEKHSERYICKERYTGACERSFYVGENVKQEDIHAKFEDGVLKLVVPKEDKKKVEEKKYIAIEG